MKKTVKLKIIQIIKIFLWLSLLMLSVSVRASESENNEMRIEQARIYLPDIKVYYYPGNGSLKDVTATLQGEKLTVVNSYSYAEDQNGTDYYILVDVSRSISKEYFTNIRQALADFPDGMRDVDTLTIITFGDQVTLVTNKVKRTDGIQSIVEDIDNNDDNTHLFEAFDKTAELTDREDTITRRSIAIVITDGEDCSTNESTKNEALEGLQEAGIPLYAMAVKQTASGAENAFIDDFSDFVRATQGKLFLFGQDEASDCIRNIQSMLNSVQVLELRASSNRITSVIQPLTLTSDGAGSKSIQVCPRYNQKDTEPPQAVLEQISEKELKITFSEPVVNAEKESNYKVMRDGEILPVYAVNYSEGESYETVLAFSEELQSGEYVVQFQNITDNSLEENQVEEAVSVTLTKETEAITETEVQSETESEIESETKIETESETEIETFTETESETEAAQGKRKIPPLYLEIGAVVLVLLIIFSVVVIRKNKKKKEETDREEESLLNQSTLNLEIRSEEGGKNIKADIKDKLIVGRSSGCDISLVDKLMSRQHFSIEKDTGCYYVTDLDTTNGTMVNGIRITTRCKLKNGDVIQAGSLYITITW